MSAPSAKLFAALAAFAIGTAAFAADEKGSSTTSASVSNPNCKVVHLKPGENPPSGSLSSSVTAGGGKVTANTTGGNGVTVHSGNGSSSSTVATTGSGGSSTIVTTSDGNCTMYVRPKD